MLLLVLLAIIGHGYFWVALVNRVHAVAIPRSVIHAATNLAFSLAAVIPLAVAWILYRAATDPTGSAPGTTLPRPVLAYLIVCSGFGGWAMVQWAWRRWSSLGRSLERYCRSRVSRLDPPPGETACPAVDACLMARLPGNETLRLDEIDRGLELPRLPASLTGFSILHVSDLHFTGLVGKWYFAELVRRCNEREPDLIALTGDIVDEERCIDWVPDTLARLKARYGVCFILGNHDLRIDSSRLRRTLNDGGLIDLGSRFLELELRGQRVVLAGNEVPWFSPAADFSGAPPSSLHGGPLRIVLAHSPDQFGWARRNEVDLVLAGHTHGGQICLPGIGPIFAPCLHGVRYARGVFAVPPTVMHVTKGVSAQLPLRFGAVPEAVLLVLQAPGNATSDATGSAAAM